MNFQLTSLLAIAFLACSVMAQDNSTDTAPLVPSEDVKPALSEAQAANQKVDNQELDKSDVKAKLNDAVDATADKVGQAKEGAKNAASDAADSVKDGADKVKDAASDAKDKAQNGAFTVSGFSALATSVVLLAVARL